MRENRTQGSVRWCWGNPASYLNMRHEPLRRAPVGRLLREPCFGRPEPPRIIRLMFTGLKRTRRSQPLAPIAPRLGRARWSGRHRLSPFRAPHGVGLSKESPFRRSD